MDEEYSTGGSPTPSVPSLGRRFFISAIYPEGFRD